MQVQYIIGSKQLLNSVATEGNGWRVAWAGACSITTPDGDVKILRTSI